MKFKKQISMFCLITFLFLPFNFKKVEAFENKEVSPQFDLVVTPSILYGLGELAVVLGCVALSVPMLKDMGQVISERIDLSGIHKLSDFIVDGAINVTTDLLSYISQSIKEINSREKTFTEKKSVPFTSDTSFFSIPTYFSPAGYGSTLLGLGFSGSLTIGSKTYKGGEVLICSVSNGSYSIYVKDSSNVVPTQFLQSSSSHFSSYFLKLSGSYTLTDAYAYERTSYSPDITSGYNEEKPMTTFPGVTSGTHSGLWEIPSDGYYENEGSTSFPLTDEVVKDKINEIPIDNVENPVIPDTGVIEKPNVGDIDSVPSTGDGLWDTLLGWLKTLFSPLITLLGWLGDILNAILSFLKGLVIPSDMMEINFKPLYFSFSNKFPFSIPFDLIRMINEFKSDKKEPIFRVDMSSFSSNKYKSSDNVGFTIDLTQFDELILIVRTIILITFIFAIAFKTRDIIKG